MDQILGMVQTPAGQRLSVIPEVKRCQYCQAPFVFKMQVCCSDEHFKLWSAGLTPANDE